MDSIQVSFLIAMVGCFVGLAGWLSGRDKKIANDAEWKGGVNQQLETIINLQREISSQAGEIKQHGERIVAVEQSAKQAHYRIDRLEAKRE